MSADPNQPPSPPSDHTPESPFLPHSDPIFEPSVADPVVNPLAEPLLPSPTATFPPRLRLYYPWESIAAYSNPHPSII